MKKRIASLLVLSLCIVSVFAGCKDSSKSNSKTKSSSKKAITLFNGKAEIKDQLNELAEAYTKKTGVKVTVETPGSGVDIQATLKGYYLSDKMPDIFVCEASAFDSWSGLCADLSSEKWVTDTEAAYKDSNKKVIGFPYATEAIGLIYNASVLEKAGIDPKTLTSPEAYEQAFATIDAKKAELGLTSVVGYSTEPEKLSWSAGNHIMGNYIDSGLARDDTKYIDLMNDGGKIDTERFTAFSKFIGMLNRYSDPSLLVSGTYEDQVKNFASGKYAFVTQGSWIGSVMTGDNKSEYDAAGNFKVGMAPYAFQSGIDTILTSAPSWWAVNKEGNVDEAKAFLEWCAGDEGQQILVEKAGCVSPFKSCKYTASDPFAEVVKEYISSGKTSNWHWMEMKEGIASNAFGKVFNDYAKGLLDANSFVTAISQAAADYYAK